MNFKKNDENVQSKNILQTTNDLSLCSDKKSKNVLLNSNISEKCRSYNNDNKILQTKPISKSTTFKIFKKGTTEKIENIGSFTSAFKTYCLQETEKIASRLKVKYCQDSQVIFIEWLSTFISIFVSQIFLRCSKKLVIPIPAFTVSLCLLQLSLMKKKELNNKLLEDKKKSKIEDVNSFLEQVMNINDRQKLNIYEVGIYKMKFMLRSNKNFSEKIFFFLKKIENNDIADKSKKEKKDNSKSIDDDIISENQADDNNNQFTSLLLNFSPNNTFEFLSEKNDSNTKKMYKLLKPYIKTNYISLLLEEFKKDSTNAIAICICHINANWKNGKSFLAGQHNFKSYGHSEIRDFFFFEGECKTFSGKDIEVVSIPLSIEGLQNNNLEFVMIRPLDGVKYATVLKKIGEICQLINIELNLVNSYHSSILMPVIHPLNIDSLENINFIGEKTLFYSCTKSAAFNNTYDSTNLNGLYYFSSVSIDENGVKSENKDEIKQSEQTDINLFKGKKYNIRMDIPFHYAILDTTSKHTILIGSYFGNYVSNYQRIITTEGLKKINEDKIKKRTKWLTQKQKSKINICCS